MSAGNDLEGWINYEKQSRFDFISIVFNAAFIQYLGGQKYEKQNKRNFRKI